MSRIRTALARALGWVLSPLDSRKLARFAFSIVQAASRGRLARDSLVFLLELEQRLFILTGTESCRYGGGVHTKHRHTGYHDYFAKRLRTGERVLDIGCGYGALAHDLAAAGARVVGIDRNATNVAAGRACHAHPNLEFRVGDALHDLPDQRFDTIVMSNVLEHIEDRVGFLRSAQARLAPRRWLLRVPMYERDWRVPLMEELGVDYRLDDTHFIEYRKEQFNEEMDRAGLRLTDVDYRWGEIWCEAVPAPQA